MDERNQINSRERETMSALITVAEGEERGPLLHHNNIPSNGHVEEITPLISSSQPEARPPRDQRLISLDVFRGVTVAVNCGMRGSLEPPCNAVGLIDRFFLGEQHLYQRPVYRRTEQCSVNSPDYEPLPPNAPAWCLAPFDPEGILRLWITYCIDAKRKREVDLHKSKRYVKATQTIESCSVNLRNRLSAQFPDGYCYMFFGAAFWAYILIHCQDHIQRVLLLLMSSFSLLMTGYILQLLGIPLSKPLYTLSYTFITAGASGLLLTFIFYIVDGTEFLLRAMLHSEWWGTLAFVILEILFWGVVAGFLHMKGIYVRL